MLKLSNRKKLNIVHEGNNFEVNSVHFLAESRFFSHSTDNEIKLIVINDACSLRGGTQTNVFDDSLLHSNRTG